MPVTTMESSLATALRDRGQRVTPQRLMVARVMSDLDRHVTADVVFDEVSRRMPGVSLPTVYATLELLEGVGLIDRVTTERGAVIYDPRTDEHHHLVCRRCGAISDVEAAVESGALLDAARSAGFAPDHAQVVVRGLCAACAA
jgi:Fur family ferric uptake transcriptional regulator/Fur family peroxide stress response transcriptional regulator